MDEYIDRDAIVALTEKGREALASGEADRIYPCEQVICMEITNRHFGLSCGEVEDLCERVIDLCGSAEKALADIREGNVKLDRHDLH
jgi:hypothetical protein